MTNQPSLWTVALAINLLVACHCVESAEPPPAFHAPATELQSYLAGQNHGQVWSRYLALEDLLAADPQSSPQEVFAALGRLYRTDPKLQQPQFDSLREALEAWGQTWLENNAQQLPELIRAEKDNFQPVTKEDAAQAKQQLAAAYASLDEMLSGPGEAREYWRDYLGWEDLKLELDTKGEPVYDFLLDVYKQLDANYPQLNQPRFAALRFAVWKYLVTAEAAYNPQQEADFQQDVDALADAVAAYQTQPDRQARQQIQDALVRLEETRQLESLTPAVRLIFSQPNASFRISEGVVSEGWTRPVDEVTPVRESILGARVSGTAHMTGNVSARLAPDPHGAAIELVFHGTAHTQNIARKDQARVRSSGATQVTATKLLLFDDQRGLIPHPTVSQACTQTNYDCISVDVRPAFQRLAQRIAWKKAYQQKAAGERAAANRAEVRFNAKMDADVAQEISKPNDRWLADIRGTLLRRGHYPRHFQLSTTRQYLFGRARHIAARGLGAATLPPQPAPDDLDVDVRLHETMLNNGATSLLGGVYLTKDRMNQLRKQFNAQGEDTIEGDWAIDFPLEDPVTFEVYEGGIRLTMHARGFERRGRFYEDPMDVRVDYQLHVTDQGTLIGNRQGEVIVEPPDLGDRRMTTRETATRTVMARSFENVFPEELKIDPLRPQGQLKRLGNLYWKRFTTQADGWLATALDRQK